MSNLKDYTAADGVPWKLMQHRRAITADHRIRPIHLQLSPTNRCCCKCPWCSCSGVDRQQEIPIKEIIEILDLYKAYGTMAVTITGGGEPLMHRNFHKILDACSANMLDVGIVSNGHLFTKLEAPTRKLFHESVTWCRLSITDTVGEYDTDMIRAIITEYPSVAFGISFTVVPPTNLGTVERLCILANSYENLTHIRFVCNILDPSIPEMERVKCTATKLTAKGIYQERVARHRGAKNCLIGLVKPFIYSDGYLYPCCGVQYAIRGKECTLPVEMRLGHWTEYLKVKGFDGSICDVCYYTDYNIWLNHLIQKPVHPNFI